jgi:hypothetical protein
MSAINPLKQHLRYLTDQYYEDSQRKGVFPVEMLQRAARNRTGNLPRLLVQVVDFLMESKKHFREAKKLCLQHRTNPTVQQICSSKTFTKANKLYSKGGMEALLNKIHPNWKKIYAAEKAKGSEGDKDTKKILALALFGAGMIYLANRSYD